MVSNQTMLLFKYCFILWHFAQVVCDIPSNITIDDHELDYHVNDSSIVYEYYDEIDYKWDPFFAGKNTFFICCILL